MSWERSQADQDQDNLDEKEFLEIATGRRLRLFGNHTQDTLLTRVGRWKLLDTSSQLVVFQRLPDNRAPIRFPPGRILMSGDLQGMLSPVELVSFLQVMRSSCWCIFISDSAQKTLVFMQGNLLAVQSNQELDRLGEVLLRYGYIDRPMLEQVVSMVGPGRRLGHILQEMGKLTREELYKNIRRQMEEVFYSVLEMKHGSFHVIDSPVTPDHFPTNQALNTQALVLESLKRMDEIRQFKKVLPHDGIVIELDPTVGQENLNRENLNKDTLQIAEILWARGPQRLDQLYQRSMLGPHQGMRVVYEALEQGVVRRQDTSLPRR